MKLRLVVCLCVLSFVTQMMGQDDSTGKNSELTPRIEDCRKGVDIDVPQMVSNFSQSDVVFLGEQHKNDSGHEFQLSVIRELVDNGYSVVISTEQFERDVQGAVDDYLAGRIEEEQFLKVSRPWKNYEKHYRPIIEFAKEHKMPVLASNIPRRIALDVAEGREIAMADKVFVPRFSNAPKDAYWQNFKGTMKGHIGTNNGEKLDRFYVSQCLKDDAMAESITDYLAKNSHQPKIVVHLCGHFHSDYGLGTVARMLQRNPLIRYSVVTMELQQPQDDSAKLDTSGEEKPDLAKVYARAHYVFWSIKNQDEEPKKDNE